MTHSPAPLAPVAMPYSRRVIVRRTTEALRDFLITLDGWSPLANFWAIAEGILATRDASPAGARIVALSDSTLTLDVEA